MTRQRQYGETMTREIGRDVVHWCGDDFLPFNQVHFPRTTRFSIHILHCEDQSDDVKKDELVTFLHHWRREIC